MKNIYLENVEKMFELVSNICQEQNPDERDEAQILLDEIRRFVKTDFLEFLKTDTPEDIASELFSFEYELERLSEFVAFSDFSEKNTVGLGGRFSSGKSSFLNALVREKILPTETTPTTSIPTLMGNGNDTVAALNRFNRLVNTDKDALKVLKHYSGKNAKYAFSHLLKHIFIKTPKIEYENIAFLDTPGYSKGEDQAWAANTDEKTARAQLNNSNYILWFVDADNGTISKEDIEFLKTLDNAIPILIIVTKADKKKKEIFDIIEYIKNEAALKGLNIIDVLPFSARKKNLFPVENIKKYLEIWNREKIDVLFARNFKKIFVNLSDYFMAKEDEEKLKLNKLNKALALAENNVVIEELDTLQKNVKLNIKKFKQKQKDLQALQYRFFEKIKKIGDIKGISLPEPSELDLVEKRVNLYRIVKEYLDKNGLKNNDYEKSFMEFFEVREKINFIKKSDYKKTLKKLCGIEHTGFLRDFDYNKEILKEISAIKDMVNFRKNTGYGNNKYFCVFPYNLYI